VVNSNYFGIKCWLEIVAVQGDYNERSEDQQKTFVIIVKFYSVFHRFRQAKFDNGGWILSSSQDLLSPLQPQKMKLTSKVVKFD
jgi:hypothetical protein